jgi:hypothetical protein
MKKLLLMLMLLVFIMPMYSFKSSKQITNNHLKKTDWLVGYFMVGSDEYEVYGDNYGSSSGFVVGLKKNGVSVPFSDESTWGTNYGPTGLQIGVTVEWSSGGVHSYSGATYL